MSEIKPVFEANDGTKFSDAESAQRHNTFLKAREAFIAAWRVLKRAAVKQYKTADGYDFDDGAVYWWNERCFLVTDRYSHYPGISEITLYPSQISSITVEDDDVHIRTEFYISGVGKESTFKLSDLYKKRENAEKRLVEILKERIAEFETQIKQIEK